MKGQLCPLCKDARDFIITRRCQLECGYCGFAIGNVKSLWQSAKDKANASTQEKQENLSCRKE